MTNAKQFAGVLSENFTGVEYNEKTRTGTAYIPTVGSIKFREAGSDPAVIINLTNTQRFKGGAEAALEFIEKLHDAWGNSD